MFCVCVYAACKVPQATKYSSGCKVSACKAGYRVRKDKCEGASTCCDIVWTQYPRYV